MVLYEDLRVYTIWRTEMAQYKQRSLEYEKSAEEWEILGELAQRLHHNNEAIEAFTACLSLRFSPKSLRGILKAQELKGDHREALLSIIKLIASQYRWYSEVTFSPVHPQAIHAYIVPTSFHRICYTLYGSSLKKRVQSKFGVSSRRLTFHNQSWILHTTTQLCVQHSDRAEVTAEVSSCSFSSQNTCC